MPRRNIPIFLLRSYKRLFGAIVNRLPDDLIRATVDTTLWHLERATYLRLRDTGFRPNAIVDIGANCGEWTRLVKSVFPATPVLMIEARDQMLPELQSVAARFPDVRYTIALLGPSERDVTFHVQGTGSSIYPERSDTISSKIAATMTTLDSISSSLTAPLFLKLDVQGAELDVLKGGISTLAKAEAVQLEVPLVQYNEGAPMFQDVVSFMDDHDFALHDIAGFIRPFGEHLVQLDVMFVRNGSKLRPPAYFEFSLSQAK